jgi:site-specific DNA-methyltransferase (cytosine-N4-specific)
MVGDFYHHAGVRLIHADCRAALRTLDAGSIDCCITSPPYWGLRDYGVDGQIGLEEDLGSFIAEMVEVFEHVRRVLRPRGTLWLNLGDTHANDGKWGGASGGKMNMRANGAPAIRNKRVGGLKPRGNLRYADAIRGTVERRNIRTVWNVAAEKFEGAHFATFPTALVKPMVLAGCPAGGTVLDPFAGSGTTLLVAKELGRKAIGIELNAEYCALARDRLRQDVLPLAGGAA